MSSGGTEWIDKLREWMKTGHYPLTHDDVDALCDVVEALWVRPIDSQAPYEKAQALRERVRGV